MWPTAVAQDDNKTPEAHLAMKRRMGERDGSNANRTAITSLQVAVQMWPTPMAGTPAQNGNSAAGNSDFSRGVMALWQTPRVTTGGYTRDHGQSGAERLTLSGQSEAWATPRASDAEKGGPHQAFGAGGVPLPAQAAQWPTPAAQNWKGSSEGSVTRADGKSRMDILHYRAEMGFTRPAPAITPDGLQPSHHAPISRPLWAWMTASHGRSVSRRLWKTRGKRRLNPLFVEWLMGWPPGHALCGCLGTAFTRWQRRMRGALCRLPTALGPWIWKPATEAAAMSQDDLFGGRA